MEVVAQSEALVKSSFSKLEFLLPVLVKRSCVPLRTSLSTVPGYRVSHSKEILCRQYKFYDCSVPRIRREEWNYEYLGPVLGGEYN
eukprot:834346-Rhodomonas_salina.2